MNYDSVIICGDSFGVGSGLPEEHCFEKSFGGLLAASLNVPAIFLARSGLLRPLNIFNLLFFI